MLQAEDGCANFCQVLDDWLVDTFASGKWLEKHEALLAKCEEYHKAQQKRSWFGLMSFLIIIIGFLWNNMKE